MPTTTNFGWTTPADTDLVKDGALAIRTLGNGIDTSMVDLKGGTTGQILSKASNTDMDFTWIANDQGDITGVTAGTGISGGGTSGTVTITNSMATEITAAGDIIVGTGSGTFDNLPIGTTGQVLTADTTVSPYKVKWATAASGSTFVGCSVYDTGTQSIAGSTTTLLTWNSEEYDTDAFHSTSTNTSRITIPSGKNGKYQLNCMIQWDDNVTGNLRIIYLYKNGSQIKQFPYPPGYYRITIGTMLSDLAVGDYIEVYCRHDASTNRTVDKGVQQAHFQAQYIGA